MTAYDSIERDAADVVERRHRRTFTLTQLLVACGAVCVCTLAATTTVVNTHLANFDEDSALANFDDGSAFDDDSALDDGSAFDDSALANFVDDYPEGAQAVGPRQFDRPAKEMFKALHCISWCSSLNVIIRGCMEANYSTV